MKELLKKRRSIGIVGLGLIGGSLGLELQSLGCAVKGLVNKSSSIKRAIELGLAQNVSNDPKILSDCEVIILAMPLEVILAPSKELIKILPKDAVITDVGSVKEPIINLWEKIHPRFVASHPMAGNANSGLEAGTKGLFKGRPWVATPNFNTDQEALEKVHEIALMVGSNWIIAEAKQHDKAVALISHLPVFVSAALLNAVSKNKEKNVLQLAKVLSSSGFSDTTRVGGGNPQLGTSMASYNTKEILKALSTFQISLNELAESIRLQEWDLLMENLEKAQRIRPELLHDQSILIDRQSNANP